MDVDGEIYDLERLRKESVKFLNDFVLDEMSKSDIVESVKMLNNLVPPVKKESKPKTKRRSVNNGFRVKMKWLLPERRKSSRLANKDPTSYVGADSDDDNNKENTSEWEGEDVVFKKKRVSHHRQSAPPEINEDYINKVCYQVSSKVYSSKMGSSCHQCRQKTMDSKTVCKSGRCIGVRGQFCGVCLLNRYGENAEDALRNPRWSCPPCRGICNCSICRTRQGKRPTGILTPIAQAQGHKSVKDYLISLRKLDHKIGDIRNVEYLSGDVLGFSKQGDVYSIPGDDDEVMGFQNSIPIHVTRLPNPDQARFKQVLRDLEADN